MNTKNREPGYYRVIVKGGSEWENAYYENNLWTINATNRGLEDSFFEKIESIPAEPQENLCPVCGKYKRLSGNGIMPMRQLCECGTVEPCQLTRDELKKKAEEYMAHHDRNIPRLFFGKYGEIDNPFTCPDLMVDFYLEMIKSSA